MYLIEVPVEGGGRLLVEASKAELSPVTCSLRLPDRVRWWRGRGSPWSRHSLRSSRRCEGGVECDHVQGVGEVRPQLDRRPRSG